MTISRYEENKLSKHVALSSADTPMLKKVDTRKCPTVDVQNRFEITKSISISVNLTETEYGLLKTFYPRSRILSGRPCIDKDALCVVLQQSEKADEVIKQFQSAIEQLKTLNTAEIRFIDGITERQFKDIKDNSPGNVYYNLSIDRKKLTLFSDTYENIQVAKFKTEVYLGLQQQRDGRRNRIVHTEPVYTSDSRKARFN